MAMFWAVLVLMTLAVGLIKLGALSVWVAVLKVGLVMAGLVICLMAVALLWRRILSGIKGGSRTP